MIKVGLIGFGFSAKTFHIPLINTTEGLELTAISSSKIDLVKEAHPLVNLFSSASKLIMSTSVDLVVITAPNDAHYALAKLCLEHGLHVIVEKPMVTTVAEAEDLIRIAETKHLLLSVFHNRRWDGDFLTLKKLVDNNALGDIKAFESRYDRFRPTVRHRWRELAGPASGTWYDLGSHLVDQALYLFGLPESLTAICLPTREGSETTDYFHVQLHYPNIEIILHGSSFCAAPNHRFKCEGSKATFVKHGYDPQEDHLKAGLTPIDTEYGNEAKNHYGRLYTESSVKEIPTEAGCYQHYYKQTIDTIHSKNFDKNPVDPRGVVQVLRILEVAEESSKKRRSITL